MRSFLRIISTLVAMGVIMVVAYVYNDAVRTYIDDTIYNLRTMYEPPCSRPIAYSIGSFDTKFGISREYFLNALSDAEAIWEEPFGRELFVHEPDNGRMKINLIHDYRQEASSKLQSIGMNVETSKAAYDDLETKYTALKSEYAAAKARYDIDLAAFKAKYDAYQEKVNYWNQRGGAPRSEYQSLQNEQIVMKNALAIVRAQEAALAEMVSRINALVVTVNQIASSLNLDVKKYNTIGASLGESFEEGLFSTVGYEKVIEIYEFKNRDGLVRVLAHELGHALGLDHVKDPTAIMYSFNQSTNMKATSADMAILAATCKK